MKDCEALHCLRAGGTRIPLGIRVYNTMRVFEERGDGYLDDRHDRKPAKDSFYAVVPICNTFTMRDEHYRRVGEETIEAAQRAFGYCAAGFEKLGEFLGEPATKISEAIRYEASKHGLFVKVSFPGVKRQVWVTIEQAHVYQPYANGKDAESISKALEKVADYNKKYAASLCI